MEEKEEGYPEHYYLEIDCPKEQAERIVKDMQLKIKYSIDGGQFDFVYPGAKFAIIRGVAYPFEAKENVIPLTKDYDLFKEREQSNLATLQSGNLPGNWSLKDVPRIDRTYQVALEAVKISPENFQYVRREHFTDELLKEVLSRDGRMLRLVQDRSLNPELYQIALENDGSAFTFIPHRKCSRDLCEVAISSDVSMINEIPANFADGQMDRFCIQRCYDVRYHELEAVMRVDNTHLRIIALDAIKEDLNRAGKNIVKGIYPEHYGTLPPFMRSDEVKMIAVEANPIFFFQLPVEELTPPLCLKVKADYEPLFEKLGISSNSVQERIPESIKKGNNIYSFAMMLNRATQNNYSYQEYKGIYNGAPLRVANFEKEGTTYKDVGLKWDKEKGDFTISWPEAQLKTVQQKEKNTVRGKVRKSMN